MATKRKTTKRPAAKSAAGSKTKRATKRKAKKATTGRTATKRTTRTTKRAAKRKAGPATPTTARRPRAKAEMPELGEPERLDLQAEVAEPAAPGDTSDDARPVASARRGRARA